VRTKEEILKGNVEYSDKFIQSVENPALSKEILNLISNNNIESLIDLGCGDGAFIFAIKKEFPKMEVVGIDISPRRIFGLKKKFPRNKFYVKDVCDTKLKNKFDFVHSSQVIEHVPSDKEMAKEMRRLLKDGGIMFCSSVIKKPFAVYKYRCNGKFALDPTHVREYGSQEEFLNLFRKNFKLLQSWTYPVKRKILGIHVRIPGYYLVFGIWEKRK